MAQTFIYAGFLSYAHADEAVAARLHRALETYKIPKGHTGTLSPIFRDANELTAHHSLSEKIRGAVSGSRVLIVLCSPAAKASHWVNEEIRLFRKMHGEAAILCVLAEGTPDTSFPPALVEEGREPLAANLGNSKESFRLGVTQIAAAMLGVGLDSLIQRDSKRRRRRFQVITAAALAFSGVMGVTAFTAVEARNEAQASRAQAEGLVEYMITDLKEKLEPVGRLDILDGVGERAVEYYDAQDISKLSDESLMRQASARHVLGDVADDTGRPKDAEREIRAAATLTQEVFDRNPDDADAMFAHSQSVFWMGELYVTQEDFSKAEAPWLQYDALAQRLYSLDPNKLDWILEAGWAKANLGILAMYQNNYNEAISYFKDGLGLFETGRRISPENNLLQNESAKILGRLSKATEKNGSIDRARSYIDMQVKHYNDNPEVETDYRIKYAQISAKFGRVRLRSVALEPQNLSFNYDTITDELEKLVDHDPENIRWKLILLQAYSDYYFDIENPGIKNTIANKMRDLANEVSQRLDGQPPLELFYAELIDFLENAHSSDQSQKLNTLAAWESQFQSDPLSAIRVKHELMVLYNKFDEPSLASDAALKVIKYYGNNFSNYGPRDLNRLVESHVVLGQCGSAGNISQRLNSRGYKSIDIRSCNGLSGDK